MKGTRYVVLKRDFADFIANHPISMQFYNWITDMPSGDESYFSTLATFQNLDNGTIIQDLKKNTTQGQERNLLLVFFDFFEEGSHLKVYFQGDQTTKSNFLYFYSQALGQGENPFL